MQSNLQIAVVGLGYVGLPVTVAFGKKRRVIGFDVKHRRVEQLSKGEDVALEVSRDELDAADVHFTSDPSDLRTANFIIVAVPTPIDSAKRPDLDILKSACKMIGRNLCKGTIVVFESTVYPGVTEDICLPILESESGLKGRSDFKIGYSPERINPSDKEHTFTNIRKIVSGQDDETLNIIADVYSSVVQAGVHKAPSIKVAEAAKVIENTQRDLNAALMNELAIIFGRLQIDTQAVLAAANTKWNFIPFEPGLVGGHCIGVDPYYLTHKAEEVGYHPQVILAGRRINDSMGKYVADETIKRMISAEKTIKGSKVLVMGLTFKENVSDIRNSRVIDIIRELAVYGVQVSVYDPHADPAEVEHEYGITMLHSFEDQAPYDGVVIAVKHRQFYELGIEGFERIVECPAVISDVKGVFQSDAVEAAGMRYWRL